ncbi:hypothetical protein BC826DRAFT_970047 [Russula brevipes]|nr:hypothetical protein BC826DRAFT_970047 [Russula brevipes]
MIRSNADGLGSKASPPPDEVFGGGLADGRENCGTSGYATSTDTYHQVLYIERRVNKACPVLYIVVPFGNGATGTGTISLCVQGATFPHGVCLLYDTLENLPPTSDFHHSESLRTSAVVSASPFSVQPPILPMHEAPIIKATPCRLTRQWGWCGTSIGIKYLLSINGSAGMAS